MTVEIGLVFLIIGVALYLFATEKLPVDVTALAILVTVMAIPILFHSEWLLERGVNLKAAFPTPSESLSGLSSTATVTVLCMFILSGGISRSGLIHLVGKRLFPFVGNSEMRQIIGVGLLVGLVSGFINNTAAVAIAIPLVLDMVRRSNFQASRVLIPVSFFAMMGGTLTLIGTSTNILASSILADDPRFGRQLGMFEFTHLGLIVLGVGVIYFLTIGRFLLPRRDARPLAEPDEEAFVIELAVGRDSSLIGKSLEEAKFEPQSGAEIMKLTRGEQTWIKRARTTNIEAGDVIMARANVRQIMDLIKENKVDVLSDFGDTRKARTDGQLVPVLLRNRGLFNGRTARAVDFWKRYQGRLIGLDVRTVRSRRLSQEKLHVGEIVLLEISKTALTRLHRNSDVVVLGEYEDDFDRKRMMVAGGIVAGVILLATLTPMPIVLTAIAGVIAMVATGCISKQDMYADVSWDVIFLLAGVIPLGIAMTKSGAADWLGSLFAIYAVDWHPVFILMALYAITTLLTEVVSNNASAVILIPVAMSVAELLGLPPMALALAVMFAASTSFLSPVGYQTNTMIYGTGVLRFTDFIKVGGPLNVILMVVTSLALNWLWPLQVVGN
ncbi:MAG: SLC13 family permease [Wenzhouxiangellaceae bacterium]|nr:SLC13 family permease [Wenzhouxiangellaceae bacterium]